MNNRLIKDASISHINTKHIDFDQKSIIEEEEPLSPYNGFNDTATTKDNHM
jgi:hypothetical protein